MTRRLNITDPLLLRIGDLADGAGIRAFVVGGYVRDLLRGAAVKDIDVVVLGNGVAFAERVARELRLGTVVKFEKFGTAMIQGEDRKLEFVGARRESYHKESRKPAVEQGSIEDDLARRDFTVNAIAAPLNAKDRGEILDPYAGRADLKRGLLRTPLDPRATFDDDPLRIMRAFRFAAQLGFSIDSGVLEAAAHMAERLSIVSQERISEEFLKIMESPRPSAGLDLMQVAGVMRIVFPEVADLQGVEQRREYHHKDVFAHTLKVVDNVSDLSGNVWLRMAALLHDIAKPRTKVFREGTGWTFHGHEEIGARMVKPIFRRMRFPFHHLEYVEKLVRLHLRPMALVDEEVTDSAVRRLMFEAGSDVDDLMMLCRADITSKNARLVAQVRRNYDSVAKKMVEVEEKDRIRTWQPPLRGDEIMQICGLESGPAVGRLKQAITDAILDGKLANTHDAALAYLLVIKDEVLNASPMHSRPNRKPGTTQQEQ